MIKGVKSMQTSTVDKAIQVASTLAIENIFLNNDAKKNLIDLANKEKPLKTSYQSLTKSMVDELYGIAANVSMTLDEIRDERLGKQYKNTELLEELDKGIDDVENGRVTSHEDTKSYCSSIMTMYCHK